MREEGKTFLISTSTSGLLPGENRRQFDLTQEECSIVLLSKSSSFFFTSKREKNEGEEERKSKWEETIVRDSNSFSYHDIQVDHKVSR